MPTAPPLHPDSYSRRHLRRATTSNVRWQRDVPEAIRSLDTLTSPDYADIVTATVEEMPSGTPEQLVRAVLDGLPRGLPRFVSLVQRAVLGLRLQLRPSPDHLLGWKISERAENWLRIEAASWFLTGHVVFHADNGRLSVASFIRYDRWPAAFIWPPVSLIHRQVALAMVRNAVKSTAIDARSRLDARSRHV